MRVLHVPCCWCSDAGSHAGGNVWQQFLKQMALSLCQHRFTRSGVLHGMLFHILMWICDTLFGNLDKLAGETYRQTDADFLDSERDTFRDDGSTASTAVLVVNHLYVANVGDSRAVISKAGKGNTCIIHLPFQLEFEFTHERERILIK